MIKWLSCFILAEWARYIAPVYTSLYRISPLYRRTTTTLPHTKHYFSFWRLERALLPRMRLHGRSVPKHCSAICSVQDMVFFSHRFFYPFFAVTLCFSPDQDRGRRVSDTFIVCLFANHWYSSSSKVQVSEYKPITNRHLFPYQPCL